MKDQAPLSPGALREAFDAARAEGRKSFSDSGTGVILKYLSETVSQLQSAGDIWLVVRNDSSSNAYDMMYTISGHGGGTINAHGFIKCGETNHLFAVASRHDSKDVARLYISRDNVIGEGGRITTDSGKTSSNTVIPGTCYDFNEDAEALQKLQKKLALLCAGNEAMLECDKAGVFNKEPASVHIMQKPSGKLKL